MRESRFSPTDRGWRVWCIASDTMINREPKLVTIGRLAAAARAGLLGVRALVSARLLRPADTAGNGNRLFHEADHVRARILLDMLDCGVTLHELRQMDDAAAPAKTANDAASSLVSLIDRAIARVTSHLDRLQKLREDLVQTRAALYRCHQCANRGPSCVGCPSIPNPPPEALEVFFLPQVQ